MQRPLTLKQMGVMSVVVFAAFSWAAVRMHEAEEAYNKAHNVRTKFKMSTTAMRKTQVYRFCTETPESQGDTSYCDAAVSAYFDRHNPQVF